MDKNKICLKLTPQEQHRSSYQKMLNNIASDLDLLLNDLCHIHPYQDSANSTKFKTFGKGQNYSDSSPGFGEDSAFGTLASTDSFNSDQKLRSDSIQSSHLEVFGLNHQGLVIPSYPDKSCASPSISSSDLRSITTVERLTKTHPIWCLPDVGRSGAVHLLKDREIGTFIVRNSSQPNTMALSVQFPENGQQNVDHYLIESTPDGFRLNGSLHFFKAIPELLAYYCENIDELPHKLLPLPAIRNARTLQELVSLSHLGQDLWTSSKFEKGSISYLSSTSGNVHAALHKSVSEPINITNACKLSQSNHSIPVTLPSPLVQNLSNTSTTDTGSQVDGHSSSKSSHSVDSLLNRVGNCNVPLHLSKSKSDSAFSMHEGSALCEMCGSKISSSSQSRTVSPASSVNSGENSRSNSSHSSLKNKSTLYFTTPIELLHIPENQYFKSELSDKMSDYEDIWRSSAAHTPMSSMKNTPVPSVRHSLVSSTGPNISVDLSASHVEASTLNNMCSPDLKEIPQKIISTSLHNDLNNSQQLNFKSKNNLQRALSLDEASNQNCQKTSIDIDTLSERGLTKAETKSTSSVCTQTSPVVVKHKPPNLKSVNRDSNEKNSGDRKSNSSTSTVVSSLKSPVYAEPFDALSPSSAVKEMGVYVPRVRRRSAPSMGAQSRKLRAISHNPTLETIFSPDCDNTQNFEFKENGAINERLMNSEFTPPPSGMRRTQSAKVRSTRDRDKISHPLSKENLEEVKAKLESLNTKRKVKRTQSENIKQTNTEGLNLRSVKKELKLLEEYSEKGKTTATSTLRKFPVYQRHISIESSTNSDADWSTMEDMISQNNPGLTVKPIKNLLLKSNYRVMSEYDNLSNQYAAPSAKSRASTGTVFCKPWDNSLLDKLMVSSDPKLAPPMDLHERILSWQIHNEKYSGSSNEQGTTTDSEHVCEPEQGGGNQNNQQCLPAVFVQPPSSRDSTTETITECKGEILSSSHQTLKVKSSDDEGVKSESGEETLAVPVGLKNPVIQKQSTSHHHHYHQQHKHHPDVIIKDYIVGLSHDKSTTFGSTIENFIQCTIDSQETNPHIVTRNVRQFMTGIKNYLVKHGEGQLEDTIEKERKRLSSNEILNIDATIERALHVCVLQPLKHHIYTLFVNEYTRNGSLKALSNNIKYARTKSAEDIGLRPGLSPPDGPTIDTIKQHFNKMQKAYSPVKKLQNLLKATSCIHSSVSDSTHTRNGPVSVGADDFLPMLIYVLVHCGLVAAEIEADYIWDLVHQSLLNGEAGYYLTSLSSAVLVIKNFREMQETSVSQHEGRLPSISDMQGFLKLAIPDELRDSITWKTLPVRPNMTTKDVCSMIAHKFKITNLQDYGLYILVKGLEIKLGESECPQVLKVDYLSKGDECVFAFKRIAANIAWPMSMKTKS